jgi:hypothetical protein
MYYNEIVNEQNTIATLGGGGVECHYMIIIIIIIIIINILKMRFL